ncbi:MAG: TlpA disulfide reductase family protein [Pseudomonadota bacterium]
MIKSFLIAIAAVWGAIRRGWAGLSPSKRNTLALALLVLVWLGIIGVMRQGEKPAPSAIQVSMLSGESTNLAALADGKPMIVNLWASWCPPCRHEMPMLAAAQKQESWASFVFANQGESKATVQQFLSASPFYLTNVILDPDTQLGRVAGSAMLPVTLFYDTHGQLIDTHLGELSAAALGKKLNLLRTR